MGRQQLQQPGETAGSILESLCVALEHQYLSSQPQVLCSAARVCKNWRQAVQQCGACNSAVVLDATAPLPQLSSFAQWLDRHAALVRGITFERVSSSASTIHGLPRDAHLQAAQELLLLSFHAAAQQQAADGASAAPAPAAAAAPPAAAAAAAAADASLAAAGGAAADSGMHGTCQQLQQGLMLHSFSCCLPNAVDMLAVLDPQRLADVTLELDDDSTESSALSAARLRLSSLQRLHIYSLKAERGSALTALAQLSQLTSLELEGDMGAHLGSQSEVPGKLEQPMADALQQLLAQQLPLQCLKLRPWADMFCQLPVLDMACLTKLTELHASNCMLAAESVLPVQLQRLTLAAWTDCIHSVKCLAPVNKLQLTQLQHLALYVDFKQQQLLLQLAQLPTLQHLALRYICAAAAAAATAPAWPLLPQLRELMIEHKEVYTFTDLPSKQGWSAILAGAAAATGLAKLLLDVRVAADGDGLLGAHSGRIDYAFWGTPAVEVAACASLTGLTRLKDLAIDCNDMNGYQGKLAPGDVIALTTLTSLTRLHVWSAEHGVGAAAATALAGALQQLQHLCMYNCKLQLDSAEGLACCEAIGRLTQLMQLDLSSNRLTQQGSMQLAGLSRLQELRSMDNEVDDSHDGADEGDNVDADDGAGDDDDSSSSEDDDDW
uniref:Uncharacterized protein n=1 Tax=Tetradesmus obliquus TaxID=3088 RepID=A0A383VKY4_TETOB|eukprot:jgi/Sobl393_1/4203/SZX65593.1